MYRRLLFLSFILLIVSCSSPQIDFAPSGEMLPDARTGMLYNQEIIIGTNLEDNPDFLTADNTKVDIYPADIGLQILSNRKRRDGLPIYNFLSISGVPSKSGLVKVSISGFTYGSMYTKSGRFNKTYTLEIK